MCTAGLSPRVRGKPDDQQTLATEQGSIPACAGEARWVRPGAAVDAVYPRVCGGSAFSEAIDSDPPGLSPRVRGKRVR